MSKPVQPSEIAREVLRQLAMRRSLPTPDNYMALYHEIAGTAATETFPEKSLKGLAAALPRKTQEQLRLARQFDTAIADKSWDALKSAFLGALPDNEPPQWGSLLRELLQQLERSQTGLTTTKKRESIEHLLQSASSPDLLFSRLQSLLRNWSQGQTAEDIPALDDGSAPPTTAAATQEVQPIRSAAAVRALSAKLNVDLQMLIAQLLENSVSVLLGDTPELAGEANQLASTIRAARSAEDIADFMAKMKKFSYRLQFATEDQTEMRQMLMRLLRLIIENISELVVDDRLLHGQIGTILEIIDKPLNLRQLDDIERRMKDVIYKQGAIKKHLGEAQDRLKTMLASFVDRLADFTEETSSYHDKIANYAERISQSGDIGQLSELLIEVMDETRVIQLDAQRSRDELQQMRHRVREAEQEVERLQSELAQASDMVRQDPLTGALNRKGMDEALEREVARFLRHQSTLCLAMLDIDNFKKLNDVYGHQVGDAALIHLANVITDTMRPQDTLARYGGEEFVILLPDTPLNEAVIALTRLQRELTRKFFMANNEKMLITFSAGVAEVATEETPDSTLKRADEAMYLAKRAGKNRVMAA